MENQSNSSTQNTSSNQYSGSGQSSSGDKGNGFNMENLTGMLGGAKIPEMLKKYSGTATTAFNRLTTTQKVVGGAILLLGATYLARGSRGGWMKKAGSLAKAGLAKKANKGYKS